ncbi:unnamed protein product, partial [Allacma fusca]
TTQIYNSLRSGSSSGNRFQGNRENSNF